MRRVPPLTPDQYKADLDAMKAANDATARATKNITYH